MATKEKTRVIFTFDEDSLAGLEDIRDNGNYSDFAETVSDSLKITLTFQNLAKRGYNQIIVRDPETEDNVFWATLAIFCNQRLRSRWC